MGSLAGADGWSITNVAAFSIFWALAIPHKTICYFRGGTDLRHLPSSFSLLLPGFQHEL
jgi:hypothetical protein